VIICHERYKPVCQEENSFRTDNKFLETEKDGAKEMQKMDTLGY
jgi:hypothetical protein